MAHFYGTLEGSRGQASRLGTKASGLLTVAASWNGSISVNICHDSKTGKDCFVIRQAPWHGQGINELIAHGTIGEPAERNEAE
jgi:hypothetical protein